MFSGGVPLRSSVQSIDHDGVVDNSLTSGDQEKEDKVDDDHDAQGISVARESVGERKRDTDARL